ncbi:ATP-binding protein [Sporichthya polymorpha]|uniref:ATP-binding protein n=1 Tax=Sporichthya polymorpha TaxID=35751 RepID=UPI000382985C|nr:AAA family ATPase [Sporichthya polymorpha]
MTVRISLLGGLRVLVDGREIDAWPGRRPAELVALLALAERRTLLRDQVLDALWPALEPEAAAAQLRKAAHHARQVLGRDDAVVLAGGRVTLFAGSTVETDLDEFERAAAAALATADPAACAAAAELADRELLPDARYEDWVAARREHVTRLRVALLRRAGAWEAVVEADPADEQAYRELMRAALAAGNRHAALRWYGRLRAALARELGLRPDAESVALYDRCVQGLAPERPAFSGRQVELATVERALATAADRGSGLVAVRGEAGIGKTALCREVQSIAAERGWQTVAVAARAGCGAYGPLVEALEAVVTADRHLLDTVTVQVRSTLAELTEVAAPAPPPPAGVTRHMVIGAAHRVLMSGPRTGAVLIVDDAHLADDGTVEACVQLARTRGARPLLVVLAYRAEAARPGLTTGVAGLAHAERADVLELGPLPPEDLVALAGDAPPDRVAAVVEMAQGNPFFALELLRTPAAGVPRSVWDVVTARFLDLDSSTVAMLRRLAVAGEDLDVNGVLAMTGLGESDAFALLDAGLAAGALVVTGTRYRFRHDLVRTALIEQVPPHHRVAVHRDAARRLADTGAEPAAVARHWLLGERPEDAIPWLLDAARRAVKVGAFAEALRHLDTLVEHAPAHPDGLVLRAEALDALGDPGAPEAYARAAEAAGDPRAQEIRAQQALALVKRGDPPSALKVLDGIAPVTVGGRMAEALAWAGAAVLGFAPPDVGTTKAAESRRLALQSGDSATLVIASWAQAAAAHARGDLRNSVWTDLLDTAALPELAVNVFDGHLCISQRLLYGSAPYPDVIAFADRFEAEAQRLGAARGRAYAVTLRGEAELLSGRLDEAATDLGAAIRLSRGLGGAVGEALALERLAELALYRERVDEAEALLDEALAVARDSDVGFHLLDRIYGTRIAAARDPDAALTVLLDAEASVQGPLETCPGCRITLAVPAAIAAARARDLALLERWEPAVDFLADVVMRLPGWYAARAEVRGHAAQARREPAAAHFAEAARRFAETGQPLDAERCAALAAGSAGSAAGNV